MQAVDVVMLHNVFGDIKQKRVGVGMTWIKVKAFSNLFVTDGIFREPFGVTIKNVIFFVTKK